MKTDATSDSKELTTTSNDKVTSSQPLVDVAGLVEQEVETIKNELHQQNADMLKEMRTALGIFPIHLLIRERNYQHK